jgi:organic radical activating enzyme
VALEAVLADTGEVLARMTADCFVHGLAGSGKGDGAHGFYANWPRPLSEADLARVQVRAPGLADPLPRAPWLRAGYMPLLHVAMDIVDNCNLRCPFCLYDYVNTNATHTMDAATFEAALRFLPYARDGEFWFSCLHEPTLHPNLMAFIDQVPREYRRKIFYTTNLAKRMPPAYYAWLADSGLHHINISIESRTPEIYEKMRKGARWRIFAENWDALMLALPQGSAAPQIRYIAMAYKSNLHELPELAAYLLAERQAAQVEFRYTYDVPHIPGDFKDSEYLEPADWAWLKQALAGFPPDKVVLIAPPNDAPPPVPAAGRAAAKTKPGAEPEPGPPPPAPLPPPPPTPPSAVPVLQGRYMFRLSWDGALKVVAIEAASRGHDGRERIVFTGNIRDLPDPLTYFAQLDAGS